jgi:hypothetical protein
MLNVLCLNEIVVRTCWDCSDREICQACQQSDDAEMIIVMYVTKITIYFILVINLYYLSDQFIHKHGFSCSNCLTLTNKKSVCSSCEN